MTVRLDGMRTELRQQARIWGRTMANEWERELKSTNPVDTGNMRDKTTVRDYPRANGVLVEAKVDTDYALYVSEGTRPHVIVPRRAKVLRFNVGGRTVYATKVNHPGTRANPWWTDSLRRLPSLSQRVWSAIR